MAQRRDEIEEIIKVFSEYIKNSVRLELLWSEKLGYVLIEIDDLRREDPDYRCEFITDGKKLCSTILLEIAYDVLEATGSGHSLDRANAKEQKAILKELERYLQFLPQYRPLTEQLFD